MLRNNLLYLSNGINRRLKRWRPLYFIGLPLTALFYWSTVVLAVGTNDLPGSNTVGSVEAMENPYEPITSDLGSWIWAAQVYDRHTFLFWRTVDIPESNIVQNARLKMTDERIMNSPFSSTDVELGQGVEWRELFNFNPGPRSAVARPSRAGHRSL